MRFMAEEHAGEAMPPPPGASGTPAPPSGASGFSDAGAAPNVDAPWGVDSVESVLARVDDMARMH